MKKWIIAIGLVLLSASIVFSDPAPTPVLDMAEDIGIEDAGAYYTGTEVETALQEIGAGTTLDGKYLKLNGSNANTNVNIGAYDYLGTDLDLTGTIYLDDEKNLNLGNSNDFKLYYNGLTNKAYIDVATSNADLYIRANDGGVMTDMIHLDASEPQITLKQNTSVDANLTVNGDFTAGKDVIYSDADVERVSIGYGADNMDSALVIQKQADRDVPGDDLLHLTYASGDAINDPVRMHVRKGTRTLDSFSNINEESDRLWDLSVDAYWADEWRQSQLMRWESFESNEDIVPGIFRYFQMNTHGELAEVLTIKDNYVGILDSDPGYNLTVSGTAYISEDLTLEGISAGTDNTVLILSGSSVRTDEIDSRVWGTTLADLTNGVDNRLVTAVDTNSLNGEANLTFDGSTLILTGNQTVVGVITADGLTMGLNELITLNSETLKHDETDFLFSDSIKCGGASAGQSIIASGLVVNEDGGATAADDFRAETDTVSNAFLVDASANIVEINTTFDVTAISSLGDGGTTNYTEIKADGEINLHGTARVTSHVEVSSTEMKEVGGSHGQAGTTNYINFRNAQDDEAYFTTRVPYRRAAGEDLILILRWYYTGGNDNNTCEWNLSYNSLKAGEDPTTAGTALTEVATAIATDDTIGETTFTIPSASLEADDILSVKIWRDGSDALTAGARLIDVHIHFIMDKLGEAT